MGYSSNMLPRFRFAPSPNGALHLGHAYSALLNAELARRSNGQLLIRIEDIDQTRCTPDFAEQCLADLAWLGLVWERPVRYQSQHFENYAAAAESLHAQGLLYPCFCTRREVAAESHVLDPDGAPLYAGTCRNLLPTVCLARLAAGESHCWRLDMAKARHAIRRALSYTRFNPHASQTVAVTVKPERWGDAILVRKDTPTSYHLSVVVDDALQHITHVVRGMDLEASTDLHVLLQALLELPTPFYYHHPLLVSGDGEKLAKRRNSESIAQLRGEGADVRQVRERLQEIGLPFPGR